MNRNRKIFRIVLIGALCISLGTTIFALGMYLFSGDLASEVEVYRTMSMFAGPTFLLTLIALALTTKKRTHEEVLRDAHGQCGIQREFYK